MPVKVGLEAQPAKIISFSPPVSSRQPCRRRRALWQRRQPAAGAFSAPLAAPFSAPFAGTFSPLARLFALRGSGALLAFFLLLLDHFHVAGGNRLGLGGGGLFLFRARHGHGDDRDVLVADDFHAFGRLDFADVDGLAKFKMAHVHDDLFRQILGQAADLELEQDVFEHAAAVFHAGGLANGFQRHIDGDPFVFGDFMEIHVQHLAVERVVLDFLHQREAFGARVAFHGQIHEQIFRGGMVDQILEFLRADFEVLRLGLAAINDRRAHGPTPRNFFTSPRRTCVRGYAFNGTDFIF